MNTRRKIRYILTGLFLILVALNFIPGMPLFPGYALITGIIGLAAGVLFLLQAFQK